MNRYNFRSKFDWFPFLSISDDHDATRLDTTQNNLLLSVAILGPVLLISVLAFVVIFMMRRTHNKRLIASRIKDPDTYYAGDELLRITSAGDSTLRVCGSSKILN